MHYGQQHKTLQMPNMDQVV